MEVLPRSECDRFRARQFLGPITLISAQEMAGLREELERVLQTPGLAPDTSPEESRGRLSALVAQRNGRSPVPYIECRHLDSPAVFALCTHPRLLAVARALYGEDLLLWRSTFIEKAADGPEFRWHQDWGGVFSTGDEYGMEPPLLFTFWIAISESTLDNGCLRFLPGVRRVIAGVPASDGRRATLLIPDGEIDESQAVDMPLRPGQCTVFTDRAIHASRPNHSGARRLGLAVRFTVPAVKVRPHFPGHGCILVSGRDTVGANKMLAPPSLAKQGRAITSALSRPP